MVILLIGSSREIYQSLYRFPFEHGSLCFVPKDLSNDKWSSGIYQIDVPANAKSISVPITINRPSLDKQPLKIEMQLVGDNNKVLITQESVFVENKDLKLQLDIPGEVLEKSTKKIIRLKLSSCFTPRNLGLSADGRRLGVQVKGVTFLN